MRPSLPEALLVPCLCAIVSSCADRPPVAGAPCPCPGGYVCCGDDPNKTCQAGNTCGGNDAGPQVPKPDQVCEAYDTRERCRSTTDNPITAIYVTPDNVVKVVDLDAQMPFTICYTAIALFKDGHASDVTNAALWTVDRPDLGSFPQTPCLVTSTTLKSGGIVKVQAGGLGVDASIPHSANLIIELHGSRTNDGVGSGALDGPPNNSPNAKPQVVYPLDGSMHPRNLDSMNLQFFAGEGNTVFSVRFTSSQGDLTLYFKPTTCDGDRCQWQVPADEWKLVAYTNGGATATLTLSGGDAAGNVAHADPVTLSFSPDNVEGGLYYFSTSTWGILRLPFGTGAKPTPFIIASSKSNPKDCAGCHAVTQDGSKIAATYGHGDDFLGITSGSDAERFSMMPGTDNSNFQWFSPDGTKIISNFNGELVLRDGTSGQVIAKVDKSVIGPDGYQRAVMPEWSHLSGRIVFVRVGPEGGLFYDDESCCTKKPGGDWLVTNAGEIVTINYGGNTFGDTKVIVPANGTDYNYYPTWSPDDAWIAFNSGTRPGYSPIAQHTGSGFTYGIPQDKLVSYDQTTSRLRLVRSTGGTIIELAKATGEGGKTTSWPKFAPFVQKSGQLMFVTYSSKRDYGFAVTGGAEPQIWMAAIDLARIGEASSDPSYAPFWLPFQDEQEANHQAIWTTQIACEKDAKCGVGEICAAGQCLPKPE